MTVITITNQSSENKNLWEKNKKRYFVEHLRLMKYSTCISGTMTLLHRMHIFKAIFLIVIIFLVWFYDYRFKYTTNNILGEFANR